MIMSTRVRESPRWGQRLLSGSTPIVLLKSLNILVRKRLSIMAVIESGGLGGMAEWSISIRALGID